ncbi:MAG: TIGR02147 family protein [Bdellovibrionaceae bacterium]|nr:TIGR02147 family protein [Pseudobdellovibrionaceae bacterium]
MTTTPQIYDFLDYREFLKATYEYNKSTMAGFSFAAWAKKGSFKSRSFLRLVMLGKRNLTAESLPSVLNVLSLNKTQSHYFHLLVQYNQSNSYQSREFFFKKLIQIRGTKENKIVQNTYHYLANFQTPRVQLLLNRKHIKKDVASLATFLNLTESKVSTILENLKELGLAENVHGQWNALETLIDVNDDYGNLALQSFHKKSLEEAMAAIELPAEKRTFHAAILSLDEDSYQSLKQELHEFLGILIQKYKNEKPKTEKVYQVNINLIPVSEDLIHSEQKQLNESKPPIDQEKSKEFVL